MNIMKKISSDPTPVYYKLQKILQNEIESGTWGPGEKIPPERSLAEVNKVSINTVKKAILNLVHEGYLYRIQGKGTFVAGTTLRSESLRYYRLRKDFKDDEATLKIKLLELNTIKCFKPANHYLDLDLNEDLYEIKRIFYSSKNPIVYTISYLPQKMFEGLPEYPISLFEKITLYEALEKNYGLPTIYNHELFAAVQADSESADKLKIPKGSPLQFIEMISFTYRDRPYEYRRSYCNSDHRKIFREI